jgi:hypothetical protein
VLPDKLAPEWPLVIFAKVGVPYLTIFDTYEGVVLRDSQSLLIGEDDGKGLDQARAMVELLGYWVSSAQSSASDNTARRCLGRAMTSGRLIRIIDSMKAMLETSTNSNDLEERLDRIEFAMHSIVRNT